MARKIPLLSPHITTPDKEEGELTYRTTMIHIVQTPLNSQLGATIKEIREALPILDALEAADGQEYVVLEDAWWQTLCDKTKIFRFRFAHQVIADFVDAIENAETVKADDDDGLVAPPAT